MDFYRIFLMLIKPRADGFKTTVSAEFPRTNSSAVTLINRQQEAIMTKYHSSDTGVLAEENEYELEDVETDLPGLPIKGSPLLREVQQHFNGNMLQKMGPKKVAKFKASRRLESDY